MGCCAKTGILRRWRYKHLAILSRNGCMHSPRCLSPYKSLPPLNLFHWYVLFVLYKTTPLSLFFQIFFRFAMFPIQRASLSGNTGTLLTIAPGVQKQFGLKNARNQNNNGVCFCLNVQILM